MNDKELDNLFRQSLSDKEISPSDAVWQNIEHALDQEAKVLPIKKTNIWYKYAVAAALAVLFTALGFLYLRTSEDVLQAQKHASNTSISSKMEPLKETFQENNRNQTDALQDKRIAIELKNTIEKIEKPFAEISETTSKDQKLLPEENLMTVAPLQKQELELQMETAPYKTIHIENAEPKIATIKIPTQKPNALSSNKPEKRTNLLAKTLNVVVSLIDITPTKSLNFENDEEGSLIINVVNTYAVK